MSRVMIVAGGAWQCPIAKLAKEMGHYVICSNLYEDSPAFAYADKGVVADVLDMERNLEIARELKPDFVLTDQSDIAVPTVAYVSEKLGLKGIGQEIAKRFTNKYLMRYLTAEAGFPSPKFRLCHSADEAKEFLADVPVSIIKPIDSQASLGVQIVRTPEEIDEHFQDSLRYSRSDKAVLIEEYIDGTEFTVDGLKTTDGYIVTAISEKDHYEYNASVANRLFFTKTNDRFDYEKLKAVNTKMVEVLGLPFGLTHAEYKYRDGNFYLIEIAARGGGTRISSDIVPLVSGINSNKVLIDILSGNEGQIEIAPHHDCAVLGFFDFEPGLVTEIRGMEKAHSLPGVQAVELNVKVGDQLGHASDDRSRCGYYILFAESKAELLERERILKETVEVITA